MIKTDSYRIADLGPRQRQIIELMRQGLPQKEIAARLSISRESVRIYVRRACARLRIPAELNREHVLLLLADRECRCHQNGILPSETV